MYHPMWRMVGNNRVVGPIITPPIGFAHRGASAHHPENTLPAFRHALDSGVTGVETDVWITADDVVVLVHSRHFWRGLRRFTVSKLNYDELPSHIPTLTEYYQTCGTTHQFSVDIKDPAAFDDVLRIAGDFGEDALKHLWICHHDLDRLAGWRKLGAEVKLVHSTRLRHVRALGVERHAATMAETGVDAVNFHASDWTLGLSTLYHRFERICFGWDAQSERSIARLFAMELDGVYSNYVDRLARAIGDS